MCVGSSVCVDACVGVCWCVCWVRMFGCVSAFGGA